MAYGLREFCADAHKALEKDPGPAGREMVRQHLERLLANEAFVAEHLGPDELSGATELYHDPDLGFRLLAHVNRKPSSNTAHCHGPSWAVYGMAMNSCNMTEYRRLDDGSEQGKAKLERTKAYRLETGKAVVFEPGVIHELDRPLETRLVRVTGADLNTVHRYRYDPEKGTVKDIPATAETVGAA